MKSKSFNQEHVTKHIVKRLKDYADSANIKGFVVGISGGVDSAVTASLCARTGLNLLLLEMPIHQAPEQDSRAQEFIKHLKSEYTNVSSKRIDLSDTFDSFKSVSNSAIDLADFTDVQVSLSLANTRARLRMTTLYYFAGLYGYLVAGTGNKVEDFGVGFYTKYGDGGVDLSPIADLLKSEVYSLAEYLEVPQDILRAAPTDGLFGDSRTDEEQLGASYDELELVMQQVAEGKDLPDLTGRQAEVFKIYTKLHKVNKHKMLPIPVCQIPKS